MRVVDAQLGHLVEQAAAAAQLGDQQAALVADERRVDVLVGALDLDHAVGVVAGLVGEGAGADVGLLRPGRHVRDLADEVRDLGQARAAARRVTTSWPSLSLRPAMMLHMLALPQRSP